AERPSSAAAASSPSGSSADRAQARSAFQPGSAPAPRQRAAAAVPASQTRLRMYRSCTRTSHSGPPAGGGSGGRLRRNSALRLGGGTAKAACSAPLVLGSIREIITLPPPAADVSDRPARPAAAATPRTGTDRSARRCPPPTAR